MCNRRFGILFLLVVPTSDGPMPHFQALYKPYETALRGSLQSVHGKRGSSELDECPNFGDQHIESGRELDGERLT